MTNGCMGARQFWPLYDWSWNRYHELNAEVCGAALRLSARGRREQYSFPGETAAGAISMFNSAIERYAGH
jgi:hypothetical protein